MEDSYSAHDLHVAGLDFATHYYVADPSYGCGCGDDAADLDFGCDYFSVYADPVLGYDCAFYPCFYYDSDSSSSCERAEILTTEKVLLSFPRKKN